MSLCEQVSHLTSVGILSVPTVRGGGGGPTVSYPEAVRPCSAIAQMLT